MANAGNPLAKLTDKDLLLYNPNYLNFLEKLKKKAAHRSELGAILNLKGQTRERMKKKELALFAFAKTQSVKTKTSIDA